MLTNLNENEVHPDRVVVLGNSGFVGSAVTSHLKNKGINVVGFSSSELDLCLDSAIDILSDFLSLKDCLLLCSAEAPCKTPNMMVRNLKMAATVCSVLEKKPIQHLLYLSSDAVYGDFESPMTEKNELSNSSLHGSMHLAREKMIQCTINIPTCFVRPTLIYGESDPHNGYGPNQFRRLAEQGLDITLFGDGEEQRDHVYIDDVASLMALCITHQSVGNINVASGTVHSFMEVAMKIRRIFNEKIDIVTTPRKGPMPHNGYRAFDISAIKSTFPNFPITDLDTGLELLLGGGGR